MDHNTIEERNRCRSCNKCREACPLSALDEAYRPNVERCLSYLLQSEYLPEEAQAVMDNRVGDCEICQEACPWNKKHLDNPLPTNMTKSFKKKMEDWERFFYLPDLVNLQEVDYGEKLGKLNTGIPYHIFHRNVSIAMEKARKVEKFPSKQQRVT